MDYDEMTDEQLRDEIGERRLVGSFKESSRERLLEELEISDYLAQEFYQTGCNRPETNPTPPLTEHGNLN